jgi:hypothetical protein
MTPNSPLKPPVLYQDEPELLAHESKSFDAFDKWMDEQVELLVAQWIHTAAPNAQRAVQSSRKFGR